LGTGVGYRFVGTSSSVVRRSYSNPYITFKLKLFLGYIYKGIFKPDKIRAEKAAYQQEKQEHRAARQQRKLEKQDAP
ncbi:MAG: hypothetical protein AAGB22_08860, partial [Bacteroidota bacterium]